MGWRLNVFADILGRIVYLSGVWTKPLHLPSWRIAVCLSPPKGGYGYRRSGRDKYGPPTRTEYRLIVENLSSRCSWQDLKVWDSFLYSTWVEDCKVCKWHGYCEAKEILCGPVALASTKHCLLWGNTLFRTAPVISSVLETFGDFRSTILSFY